MSKRQRTRLQPHVIQVDDEFGRWTVVGEGVVKPFVGRTRTTWMLHYPCRCECGTERDVASANLRNGMSTSCGCTKIEASRLRLTKHGQTGTRLYKIWAGIIHRCENQKNPRFSIYGGRGITMCPEWRASYAVFHEWAHANGYRDDLTIERLDVNGHYEPSNCTWIPGPEQAKNRRAQLYVDFMGERRRLMDLAEESGIPYLVAYKRLKRGWTPEQALSIPVDTTHAFQLRRLK